MDDTQRAGIPSPADISARTRATAQDAQVAHDAAGAVAEGHPVAEGQPVPEERAGGRPAGPQPAAGERAADEAGAPEAALTGDAAVDEALRALDGLAALPLPGHVAAFDAVHGALQDRLAEAQG